MGLFEPLHQELALNLGLAVIASSAAPLLLMDADRRVLAASPSFSRAFALLPDAILGRKIEALGDGEWDIPQLRTLLSATLAGDAKIDAYEVEIAKSGQGTQRLSLNAQRLDYAGAGPADARLLLTVCDITDAHAQEHLREVLARDNALLLKEVRHRVANSLQIIASVLMQNARRVSSLEARGHLHDAHQRVIAVAELERQLAVSSFDEVELQTYFGKLCDTLRASMISPAQHVTLEVCGSPVFVAANVSISLGLIVTELVINALKHAFPDGRRGAIVVEYRSAGSDWTLSVADDGVGMHSGGASPQAGLGATIVEALARQLGARVEISGTPGCKVSILYDGSLRAAA
ncbi:MAG TPA: histidine kinase dimerization/phosphoacceptor domain -containing protein [Phenylobacterium sp.]|uniref:sensor histidine kinase n=1 Tax=Phenylobacterium sp. TaxID=1871053 RepID=UPI002F936072